VNELVPSDGLDGPKWTFARPALMSAVKLFDHGTKAMERSAFASHTDCSPPAAVSSFDQTPTDTNEDIIYVSMCSSSLFIGLNSVEAAEYIFGQLIVLAGALFLSVLFLAYFWFTS